MREKFAALGIAHLLAISGLHMAILGGVFFLLFFSIGRSLPWLTERVSAQRVAAGLTVPLLVLYWSIVGLRPSTTRALVMLCVFFGAPVFSCRSSVKTAVSAAFLGLASWRPFWVGTPGFQLSFLAVICLCLCGEFWNRREGDGLQKGPRKKVILEAKLMFFGLLGVSVVAAVATWGLVAFHFGRVAPAGVLVNLVVVPFVCWLLLPLAFAGVVIGVMVKPLGLVFLSLAAGLSNGLLEGLEWILPMASLLPSRLRFTLLQVSIYYASAAALVSWRHPATRWKHGGWMAGAGALLLVGSFLLPQRARIENPKLTFMSLGRGEATLIQLPSGHSILVDTGERGRPGRYDLCRRVLLPLLRRRGVQELDLLVISHPHSDHIGNAECVLEEVPVKELWWNGDRDPEGYAEALLKKCEEKKIPVAYPESRTYGETHLRVVHPPESSFSRDAGPDPRLGANDNSLVFLLTHPNGRALLTGDIGREVEATLSKKGVQAEVLKVPHHGSFSSSCGEFIKAVSPLVAVVCGRGPPPRFEKVESRYQKLKVPLLTTWRRGVITVELREGGVQVMREGWNEPCFYDHITPIGSFEKNKVQRLGF